jgi:hypothetical protein
MLESLHDLFRLQARFRHFIASEPFATWSSAPGRHVER